MTVNVDLDKWEEITFEDVKKGDKIRVIVTQGEVVSDTKAVADYLAGYSGWYARGDVNFLSSPGKFSPIPGGSRKIYRRKPKPFELPTGLGAVVEATRNDKFSERTRFVFADPNDKECSWVADGSWHDPDDMLKRYKDFVVISKGVNA